MSDNKSTVSSDKSKEMNTLPANDTVTRDVEGSMMANDGEGKQNEDVGTITKNQIPSIALDYAKRIMKFFSAVFTSLAEANSNNKTVTKAIERADNNTTAFMKPEDNKPSANEPPSEEQLALEHSPIGKAVHDFGKSLRNTAIWLLIIDIILSIIIDHKNGGIVFDGRYRYDRFNADFYTTVSRGLAEVSAYLEGIFGAQVILANFSYFITGIVINVTVLAITVGKGIMKIGSAIAIERKQRF